MKRKLNYGFALFVVLTSIACCCKFNQVNRSEETMDATDTVATKETSFMELVENIPTLKLPYTFYCGLDESLPRIDNLEKRLIGYLPENVIVAGKIPIDNDLIYIVYGTIGDIIYPHLNIYNQNGEKLDSMYLHISWCAADEWGRVSTTTTINKDYSISMTDTSEYIHYLDTKTFITDSIIVKRKSKKLKGDGLYEESLSDTVRIK